MSNNMFRTIFSDQSDRPRPSIFDHDPRAVESMGTFGSIRNHAGEIMISLHGMYAAVLIGRPLKPSVSRPWFDRLRDEAILGVDSYNEDDEQAAAIWLGVIAVLPGSIDEDEPACHNDEPTPVMMQVAA